MWNKAENFLLKDKYIAPLIKKYGHCTIEPRSKKYYFEDLVDAIIQQQLSVKAASSIFNKLKEVLITQEKIFRSKNSAGYKLRKVKTLNIVITPQRLLELEDNTLRGCGLSRAKASYLKNLSEKALNEGLRVNEIALLPDGEIINKLILVKGIGEWTAQMFLMFTLGRPDVFPSGDLGLRNAFNKVVGKEYNPKGMEKFAYRWKPYRTIASWYIWKSQEN